MRRATPSPRCWMTRRTAASPRCSMRSRSRLALWGHPASSPGASPPSPPRAYEGSCLSRQGPDRGRRRPGPRARGGPDARAGGRLRDLPDRPEEDREGPAARAADLRSRDRGHRGRARPGNEGLPRGPARRRAPPRALRDLLLLRAEAARPVRLLQEERHDGRVRALGRRLRGVRPGVRLDRGAGHARHPRRRPARGGGLRRARQHVPEGRAQGRGLEGGVGARRGPGADRPAAHAARAMGGGRGHGLRSPRRAARARPVARGS